MTYDCLNTKHMKLNTHEHLLQLIFYLKEEKKHED